MLAKICMYALWLLIAGVGADVTSAGLPVIHISHDDLGDDYPEMQEEVHLEDFFWTGSGDGPPDYLKKVHTGISKGKDVIVKTETVVATVYVDGNNEIDIPICLDCPPDDGGGTWNIPGVSGGSIQPFNYSATDRRYWLLTVMSGFYTQKDNPMLEEKLARLYRLAFTRQQSKHLGFNGDQQIAGIAVSAGRQRRDPDEQQLMQSKNTTTKEESMMEVEILDMDTHKKPSAKGPIGRPVPNANSELFTSSEEVDLIEDFTSSSTTLQAEALDEKDVYTESSTEPPYITLIPWELIQQNAHSEKQHTTFSKLQLQNAPTLRNEQVRVLIHNITQITEEDVQKGKVGSTYEDDVNEKIDERPAANQTELIYSVLVNGRPVLAVTAATDMRLVSESEVATAMGKEIIMKAEPYLREPQATPLAPATRSGSAGFIDSLQNNTALVVVSSVAILLLLLLLVALLLMGRSRTRQSTNETNRTISREPLTDRPISSTAGVTTGRSTVLSRDVGIQNFSFESEHARVSSREARINFPGPPTEHSSRRGSFTSTDNTSDSSVYCPINPPAADVQRMLDEKAANLFSGHKRRHHQYDRAEGQDDAVYTSVISEKKRDKLRHKTKRRYLSENRVGSLETSPVQHSANSSGDEVITGSMEEDEMGRAYGNFERNEAFNPHNNYNRNKLLHQKSLYGHQQDGDIDDIDLRATDAINKEIIRTLQPTERSSDTGSIGSFLSMASVKAFPKSTLPEPLNRVLDPVFVTYYDNVDNITHSGKHINKSEKPQRKMRTRHDSLDATTIATIESFPSPKAPIKSSRAASQSDNPDPGVVGPIVWERHKKRMNEDMKNDDVDYEGTYSRVLDPAAMRDHYEGLLEGAIQMYSSQDDLPMPLPTCDFTNKRKTTNRENRGSSAGVTSSTAKSANIIGRPATAQPEKTHKSNQSNQSTQPPSPSSGAWGGSIHGSHSPLVRPMSAGPFHRPEPLVTVIPSKSASNRRDLSAAPLVEAIQSELLKFKQEKK